MKTLGYRVWIGGELISDFIFNKPPPIVPVAKLEELVSRADVERFVSEEIAKIRSVETSRPKNRLLRALSILFTGK